MKVPKMTPRDDYGCPADIYFAAIDGKVGQLATALRALVLKAAPDLIEMIKWGVPVYQREGRNGWICSIRAAKSRVSLQLGAIGSRLDDPHGLLEGTGKNLRHVKIRSENDLDAPQITLWIRQAAQADDQGPDD